MSANRILRRLSALLVSAAALTACGFAPLHAPQDQAGPNAPLRAMSLSFNTSATDTVTRDRVSYLLRQAITDRMSTGAQNYDLALNSKLTRTALGVTADDITSRYDLSLSVAYVLKDIGSGEILTRDTLYAVSTMNVPSDPYARIAAQSDAEERAASDITDKLVFKLARYFNTSPAPSDLQ